jgi:mRNA interferase MazF
MFDIVAVPFPFTDQDSDKKRPALVLSNHFFNDATDNCVLSMITSANNPEWPLDVHISSIQKSGLSAPSKIRMKIFTLDSRLILKKIGSLSAKDQKVVKENLQKLLCLTEP